jgi:hypothetical protein
MLHVLQIVCLILDEFSRKTLDSGVMGGIFCPPPKKSGLGENLISYVFGRVFLKIYIQFLRKSIILA